jgi:hypothetical protein
MILSVFAACVAVPPTPDDGADDLPAPGEEGGSCLPDGTCNLGLECVDSVCIPVDGEDDGETYTLVIFHNNSGPMCLAALDWLDSMEPEHPALVVEEHLTYEAGETELLTQLEAQFQTSQGVSTSFTYLPIVFFEEQAFSGFNDGVAEMLEELLLSAESASQ